MTKEYKHRGYTFRATGTTIDKLIYRGESYHPHHSEIRPLYEILIDGDVVKPATSHPFLTSTRECIAYIDE